MTDQDRQLTRDLRLYLVQDTDRPMYVVVRGGFDDAVSVWRQWVAAENPDEDCSEDTPDGVHLVVSGAETMPDLVLSWEAPRT